MGHTRSMSHTPTKPTTWNRNRPLISTAYPKSYPNLLRNYPRRKAIAMLQNSALSTQHSALTDALRRVQARMRLQELVSLLPVTIALALVAALLLIIVGR